jgi:hypothetical protein
MGENHELFDLVALYILKRAYDSFPMPVDILHSEIAEAIRPAGGGALSVAITYTPGFLERNGYIHRHGLVGLQADDSATRGFRASLNDKGLLALKKPSLSQPGITVHERIRTVFVYGIEGMSPAMAATLISDVISPSS